MTDFIELSEKHNGSINIPDDDLYRFIIREEVRKTVLNSHNLGFDKFKSNPLVEEVRRRCERELWFLGKYFLWDTDVFGVGRPIEENFVKEDVHRRICDMFVRKDKTKSIGEQDWRKDRLILYPRGTGKSAWDRYDVVQWILNFPDIRILYLTATLPLAQGFVGETKGHFIIDDDSPSLMNLYFPEFCFTAKSSGDASELICPAAAWVKKGLDRKEKTVVADAIDATGAGGHYEVIKADDSVSEQNSANETQCKKITSMYNMKHKMLVPVGYSDKIGTRYADEDMYGEDLKRNVGTNIVRQSGPNWEVIDNNDLGLRILIGRSIVIKPEVVEKLQSENRPVTYHEAGKEGCTLLFPELHSYEWCMYEYGKDEIIFEGQQNQNPRSAVNPVFDRLLMMRHTIPFHDPRVPQSGPISQFWDFAFSQKKGRDYCTGSCCIWNKENNCVVIDLVRAKFKPLDLAKEVVKFAVKYKPYVIGIEKAAGSDLLHPAIMNEAVKTGINEVVDVCSRIDWVTPSNQKDAKRTRIRALHPWIANDLMFFVSHLPFLEELYGEFERCLSLGDPKDDIPDNLAYQVRYAPQMVKIVQQQETEHFSRADGNWQYIFDASGELYGQGESYFPSPFKGYVLTNNPETGLFELRSEEISNPIMILPEVESQPVSHSAYDGMDSILGAGLTG